MKNYLLKIISKTDDTDDVILFKKITEEVFDFISIEITNNDYFNSGKSLALYYLYVSIFLNAESVFVQA